MGTFLLSELLIRRNFFIVAHGVSLDNTHCTFIGAIFPAGLEEYGLNEERLYDAFCQVLNGEDLDLHLRVIPEVKFYKELHLFLKKWSVSCRTTKQTIGRFYCAIDPNLKAVGYRADNVYRLIEKLSQSSSPKRLMLYNRGMCSELCVCTDKIETLNEECERLTDRYKRSQKQLSAARKALQDVTNEKSDLQKKNKAARTKTSKLRLEYAELEDDFASLEEGNVELSSIISDLQTEVECIADDLCEDRSSGDFSFQTKNGRRYSPAIRKLYYTLLSQQLPSGKIADIVRSVIKCFFPDVDVNKLLLPQRSGADYMRKGELPTISNTHKATLLSECTGGFKLNTDGTTSQRKIGGVGINDVVISVNELPDGTALSAIKDVSRKLEKLREVAHALRLPNASRINWTLFISSTSDSAASQQRLNKI